MSSVLHFSFPLWMATCSLNDQSPVKEEEVFQNIPVEEANVNVQVLSALIAH